MTMRKIDVDFDVHQLIELERRNFGESPNDVLRRLLGLRDATGASPPAPDNDQPATSSAPPRTPAVRRPRPGELLLRGKTFQHRSGKEAMTIVLRELAISDAGFLGCCAQHPSNQGRKRRHIARTLAELYPDRPDLHDQHEVLPGGWFVGTNISNAQKADIIKIAASCAKLELGTDIAVPALGVGDPKRPSAV